MPVAYQCIKANKECDGCGMCQLEQEPCPNCGRTGYEVKYYIGSEWIGCDECVRKEYQ